MKQNPSILHERSCNIAKVTLETTRFSTQKKISIKIQNDIQCTKIHHIWHEQWSQLIQHGKSIFGNLCMSTFFHEMIEMRGSMYKKSSIKYRVLSIKYCLGQKNSRNFGFKQDFDYVQLSSVQKYETHLTSRNAINFLNNKRYHRSLAIPLTPNRK